MYPVSQAYKTAIRARTRTDSVTGVLTLKDGTVLPLQPQDLISGSLTLDNQCVTGEELAFGCAYMGQAALSLRTERVGFAKAPLGGCALPATLKSRHYAGGSMRAVLTLDDGREVLAQCPSADRAQGEIGERVLLSWNPGEAPVVR